MLIAEYYPGKMTAVGMGWWKGHVQYLRDELTLIFGQDVYIAWLER